MLRLMLCGCLTSLALAAGEARAQSPSVADLQRQINELRSEVTSLRREVADLKQQRNVAATKRPTNLAARLTAIDSIFDFSERQSAYAKLATDAADEGNNKLATDTLAKLNDYNVRGQVSYRVALSLAAQGQEEEAIKLANSIGDFTIRQKLLAKIAKGDTTP